MERRCGQKYELSPGFSTFDRLSPIFDRYSSTLDCFSPLLDPILNVTAQIYAIILRGYTTLDVIPRPSIFILDPRSSSSILIIILSHPSILGLYPRSSILDLHPRSSLIFSSFDPRSSSFARSTRRLGTHAYTQNGRRMRSRDLEHVWLVVRMAGHGSRYLARVDDQLPGPSSLSRSTTTSERKAGKCTSKSLSFFKLFLHCCLDRFERALKSARETLKRARYNFQSAAIASEQKELFGYCSKTSKGKKKARPSPWTKQFYCLAYCDQDHVPLSEEELDELYHAGLGMKKITFPDMNTTNNSCFRSIIIENYPALHNGGGFEFLQCVPNTKRLEPFSEVAQRNPHVLQERAQKGKVFIRPLQRDLLRSLPKRPQVCHRKCMSVSTLVLHISTAL